jgi:hypothetical protein
MPQLRDPTALVPVERAIARRQGIPAGSGQLDFAGES